MSVSISGLDDRSRRAGTVVIAHDMRERRRIEAALVEQEMLLRTEEVRRKAELQLTASAREWQETFDAFRCRL